MERLGKEPAEHLYELGVKKNSVISKIEVLADTCAQAGRLAKKKQAMRFAT